MASSFKDLIPQRERADVKDGFVERPFQEKVAKQVERTKAALAPLIARDSGKARSFY